IRRIAERMPQMALEAFRAATPGATTGIRCGLADQMYMMKTQPGIVDAIAGLLDDFDPSEVDAPYLLLSAPAALEKHGAAGRARELIARWERKLTKEAADWRLEQLEGPEGFVPTLVAEELDDLDIEDV